MPIPDSQTLLLPVLRVVADGHEHSSEEIRERVRVQFDIPRTKFYRNSRTAHHLHDFVAAIKSGDAKTAEQRMLAKYPQYQVKQFLSVFSIPAYFPAASPVLFSQ